MLHELHSTIYNIGKNAEVRRMEPLQYEARGYLKEPFRLFHLADGQRERIEYHYHTFHKIIILLAGKAGYAIEGERYDLTPGDFVLVGRGSIHGRRWKRTPSMSG